MIKCITIGVSSQDDSVILLDSTRSVTEQCQNLRSGIYGDGTYSRVEVWSTRGGLEKFRDYTAIPNVGFDLALKVDDLSIVYGSTPSFTTTFNGLVASDFPASSLGGIATYTVKDSSNHTVADVANANVGTYTVSVSWAGLPPYYVHKKKTGTLTITKKPIRITATDQAISEGDSAPTFGVTVTGLLSNHTIADLGGTPVYIVKNSDGEVVADVSAAPPGTYSIIVSGYTSNNYSIIYVAGKLTIAQDIVTITADDQTMSEGDVAPMFDATFSGFEDGDDESVLTGELSYIVKNSDGEVVADVSTAPVGIYSVIPTGLTSADNRYHLNFVAGTLTIAQDIVTITANDQTISEGDDAPTFDATFSGFEDGDDENVLTGVLSYIVRNSNGEVVEDVSTAPVGTYSITPEGLTSADNRYHLNFVAGTLTITSGE